MALIKCKMCGGDLNLIEGASTAECEFCGSVQTIPKVDDEKKLTLFARANRLRIACEFDKAAGIYEAIVADFPEEAEAYWGLVLCKYGIEYVDDPGSGKKIPTCHRSSFDSVMEDSDFEQALENADGTARKVYREEAKQIEEIRKGIISVSSNEQPYDIFICYKETDQNGDRTLDSVLAQDVYDALTGNGYRVFFSRITLEDKLGMEYEPYIFAALNSAKVMLAFGTDYEYFNAVWVKNEWSRFLKLMAKDKQKHLIPCYKGIDVYDMPKEFAKLQAQDLGKVGAIQDLLRGIEKLLPRQTEVKTVVQERVVVGGSGDNKIASLLDRGNMALEDGDWAKADSFFEDVLNNDSKNAQAYLGKTLAQEKCRTIDALIRKRKDRSAEAQYERLYITAAEQHIEAAVTKFIIPGYVFAADISDLYGFDLGYPSAVSCRQQQYQQEQTYWSNHKLLSRAEKFATGAVAENLQREKKALFAALTDRIKKAEAEATAAKEKLQQAYQAHIDKADQKAEQLHQKGLQRREADYQRLLQTAKTSVDVQELTDAAGKLDQLGDYQDSRSLAEHCRKRASEEQAKLDAEKERQHLEQEALDKKKRVRNRTIAAVAAGMTVAAIGVAIISSQISKERLLAQNYAEAEALLVNEQYEEAAATFETLGDYKDSAEKANQALAKHSLRLRTETLSTIINIQPLDVVYLGEIDYRPLRWTVVDIYNGQALLVCNQNIGQHQYHSKAGGIDPEYESYHYNEWPLCSLRTWLNRDFLDVFNEEELALLVKSDVTSAGHHKDEGTVQDFVYIPSEQELMTIKATGWDPNDEITNQGLWLRGSSGTNGLCANGYNTNAEHGLEYVTMTFGVVPVMRISID